MTDLLAALRRSIEIRAEGGWTSIDLAARAYDVLEPDAEFDESLAHVVGQFGLDEDESGLFSVVAAAEQGVSLHLLLGLLSGDDGPGRPTVAIALELAGLTVDGRTARGHFGDGAPLLDTGLVELAGEDVLLSRRLVLPDRIAAFLAGDDSPPPAIRALLGPAIAVDVEGTATVAEAIRAGHRLMWILDPRSGPGISMAAAACRQVDVPCIVADLARLGDASDADAAVSALLLECTLTGQVLVLAGAERASGRSLVDARIPVLAVSGEPWTPDRRSTCR